jgi:hypothetical protein
MRHLFISRRGFSLVQVMIAIGLSAALSVIIMHQMELQSKSSKKVQLDGELNNVKRLFQEFVSRKKLCTASFVGAKRGQEIYVLKTSDNFDDKFFAKTDEEFQKTGLIIKKMMLLSVLDEIQKFKTYMPLDEATGISTTYLRVYLSRKLSAGGKQNFFGGTELYFDIPITAQFLTTFMAAGIDRNDAINGTQGWKKLFDDKQTELNTELTSQGVTEAVWQANNLPETLAEQIKLVPELGKEPNATCDKNVEGDCVPEFMEAGVYNVIVWGASHPLLPITECGTQLSTGVN